MKRIFWRRSAGGGGSAAYHRGVNHPANCVINRRKAIAKNYAVLESLGYLAR